ncbi:hypothetical protein L683_25175 [Pseudomonas aeruginosa WC55]|nr:hypothetical protein L683_25175 [Pseudomonas aeruginosa WC55]
MIFYMPKVALTYLVRFRLAMPSFMLSLNFEIQYITT